MIDLTRAALDADQADFAAMLAASLPDASLHEAVGVAWVDSGLPDGTFNFVYRAPSDVDALARGLVGVREYFEHRGAAFHWCVGLREEPRELAGRLTGHGLRLDEQEPGMGLVLDSPLPPGDEVPGLTVRPVTDGELLWQWMRTWGCGAPDHVIELWYRVYSALPYGPGGPLRMFVGFLDGEPVGTVFLRVGADAGAVHYVVTRPEFRGRGIGRAMTEVAVREARVAGCRLAVLSASEDGVRIYQRLGFRERCQIGTYVWFPDGRNRGAGEVDAT
ncbi:MAG TPA: GNAT family N-acetyltransferase [Pseudonocardiaceae bacterium]